MSKLENNDNVVSLFSRPQVLGDVEATKRKSGDENEQLTIEKWENVCLTTDWLTNSVLNIYIVTALLLV